MQGVPQPVHHFQNRVHGRVKANGVLGRCDVVVNGSGNADAGDSRERQVTGAAEGAVSANDHNAVNALVEAGLSAPVNTILALKLQASGGVQLGSGVLYGVGYAGSIQLGHLVVQQTVIAVADTDHLHALVDCGEDHRPDGSVHTGCVSAAGQNSDGFHFLCHIAYPPSFAGAKTEHLHTGVQNTY